MTYVDPESRRNRAPLRDRPDWGDAPDSWALVGGKGDPTRTRADMRIGLAEQMSRYLGRFPDPAGEVDAELAAVTAGLIVADHYRPPGTVLIRRDHLLKYVAVARKRLAAEQEGDGSAERS